MCRYCEPESTEQKMCVDCRRRYVRLSTNRSKLMKLFSSADVAKVTRKILDDLAEYRRLQALGCVVPPVVQAAMRQFESTSVPYEVCGYCGEEAKKGFHKSTRMCESCYKFYNYFNTLYYGPKRPGAYKTRKTYYSMLGEICERRDAGLKIPGVAATALKEDWRDDKPMETDS